MSRITIVVDSDPGEILDKTVRRAIEVANDPVVRKQFAGAMPRVVLEHNSTRVFVWPDDTERTVMARWHTQGARDAEDQRKAAERALVDRSPDVAAIFEELTALRAALETVRTAVS